MRALFLSDAHLYKPTDSNYQALLAFLEEQQGKVDMLALLGDIFSFWVGKETVAKEYVPLIEALERMKQQGTKLFYVEGNHDFHLGPVFTQRLNCQVFPDGGSIKLDGKNIFLAHGDLANPNDKVYRLLRKFLRSSLLRTLMRVAPRRLTMAIANQKDYENRKTSEERRNKWSAREMLLAYAEPIIASGQQAVITGHFHQPFHEKTGNGELIALGDWITQFSYAVYEDGVFTLNSYCPPTSET